MNSNSILMIEKLTKLYNVVINAEKDPIASYQNISSF